MLSPADQRARIKSLQDRDDRQTLPELQASARALADMIFHDDYTTIPGMEDNLMDETPALDVWLRFEVDEDEEPSHEANTFRDGNGFRVDWYHTAVGQISSRHFDAYADAQAWLTAQGFSDFSS